MLEQDKVSLHLYSEIRQNIIQLRQKIKSAVNSGMIQIYWEIGRQLDLVSNGTETDYGNNILQNVSDKLSKEFGSGFSYTNLRNMRQFYRVYHDFKSLSSSLSWSHYRILMRVADPDARDFYTKECTASGWSVRELERQITTFAYQRTITNQVSKTELPDKYTGEVAVPYKEFIRDPYILEFLDLKSSPEFHEKNIEQGIIDHLQSFILELGRGFSFVARQKHISIDGDDFFIDLVFYNYILKCFVLIDLKLGKVKHQDIGQMQMYVNYYKKNMRENGDNEPIGIVLCAEKNDAVVRYTLGDDKNTHIYASKYMPYMPTEEELKNELNLRKLSFDNELENKNE